MLDSALALGHDGLRLRSQRVRFDRSHRLSARLAVAILVLASVAGSAFAGATLRAPTPTAVAEAPAAVQPPYVQALLLIHARLNDAVERMGLGATAFASGEIGRAELRVRLDGSLEILRQSENQLQALDPPPDLRSAHQGDIEAVRLYEQAAGEMLKMTADGDQSHLSVAIPLCMQAAARIRSLSDQLLPVRRSWPDQV